MNKDKTNYSPFKKAITEHLYKMAIESPEFREKAKNPEKDIDKCLDYIVSEVKRTGRQGFADDEIFSMAVHYYEEPNDQLKIDGKASQCKVVVNYEIQLTESEKEEARKRAMKRLEDEQYALLKGKKQISGQKTQEKDKTEQMSLFDFGNNNNIADIENKTFLIGENIKEKIKEIKTKQTENEEIENKEIENEEIQDEKIEDEEIENEEIENEEENIEPEE